MLAATIASQHRTRRRRSSNRVAPFHRRKNWPSRTPSTPDSSWTAVTGVRWTPTEDTTARCRRLRQHLVYIDSLSEVPRTYTTCSLTDMDSSTPVKTYTHRSVTDPYYTTTRNSALQQLRLNRLAAKMSACCSVGSIVRYSDHLLHIDSYLYCVNY